jgi:hypothetical protein
MLRCPGVGGYRVVGALPQLRESRTVRSGYPAGMIISCGLPDMMMADITASVVFFFERAPDDAALAKGLTQALHCVPAFAGRLRTRGDQALEIVCDDAGVPMETFDVDQTLSEAIGRATMPASGFVQHVSAPLARSGGQPLLTVRVSRLSDGGMALGCSFQHAVGDMQAFMLLMRAWSASVEGTAPPEALLIEDRDAYLDEVLPPADLGRPGIRLLDADEGARLEREVGAAIMGGRTVQIYFGDAEVGRMRDEFSAAAGQRLSANDVLCAHVVTTIRHLDEDRETRSLAIAVDVRRRLGLPSCAVANLTNEVYLSCEPASAPEKVAAQIRTAVTDFTGSHLSIRASRAFLESIGRSRIRDCVPVGFDLGNKTFTFNSWSRFGLYDLSFEGQRPAFFSPAPNVQMPWTSWLVEGFSNSGFLFTVGVPSRLAGRLKNAEGRAALHRFRDPQDQLPALALASRKLI